MEHFRKEEVQNSVTPEAESNTIFSIKLPKQLKPILSHIRSISALKVFLVLTFLFLMALLRYGLEVHYESTTVSPDNSKKTIKKVFSINKTRNDSS